MHVFRSTRDLVSTVAGAIGEVFFPRTCANCRTALRDTDSLCSTCMYNVNFLQGTFCICCGIRIPSLESMCRQCYLSSGYISKLESVFEYNAASKNMILRLKFRDDIYHVKTYARWMFKKGESILKTASLIIPVPIHKIRLLQRKFNQSVLLAHAVGKLCRLPVDFSTLKKSKNTKPQHGLPASVREKNVAGSFLITSASNIINKSIVLIDDVVTTGSTVRACAKTLLDSGAKDIYVLTLGRTLHTTSAEMS